MSKSTKIIAGLSAVAMLGVAAMPFGAFAVTGSPQNVNVKYTINENLALAVDSNTEAATINTTAADTSLDTLATVTGNSAYTLSVKSDGTDANLDNKKGATIAPMADAAASLSAGEWGIKLSATEGASVPEALGTTNFNPVTITDQVIMERQTLTGQLPQAGDKATITYGVFAASTQSAGVYEDTLIYTLAAVANS